MSDYVYYDYDSDSSHRGSRHYTRDRDPERSYGGTLSRRAPPFPYREYRQSGLSRGTCYGDGASSDYGDMSRDIEAYRSALRDIDRDRRGDSYAEPSSRHTPASSSTQSYRSHDFRDIDAASTLLDMHYGRASRRSPSNNSYGSRGPLSVDPPMTDYRRLPLCTINESGEIRRGRIEARSEYGRASRDASTAYDSESSNSLHRSSSLRRNATRNSSPYAQSISPLSLGPPGVRASSILSRSRDRYSVHSEYLPSSHSNSRGLSASHRDSQGDVWLRPGSSGKNSCPAVPSRTPSSNSPYPPSNSPAYQPSAGLASLGPDDSYSQPYGFARSGRRRARNGYYDGAREPQPLGRRDLMWN